MNSEGGSADHVSLQGQAITIARGQLQYWFDAFAYHYRRGCQCRHVNPGAGTIGYVYRVCQIFQAVNPLDYSLGRGRVGW